MEMNLFTLLDGCLTVAWRLFDRKSEKWFRKADSIL